MDAFLLHDSNFLDLEIRLFQSPTRIINSGYKIKSEIIRWVKLLDRISYFVY